MNDTLKTWGEWGFRAVCLVLLVLNLWAKQNFVSIEVYTKDREKTQLTIDQMGTAITSMEKAVALLSRQDRQIEDHEMRIRELERKK